MLVFSFLRLLEKERSSQSSKHSEPGVRKPEGTLELFSILQILKNVANVSSLLKTHLKEVIPSSSFLQVRYLSFPGENEDVPPAVTSHNDGFQETGSAVSPSRGVDGPPAAEGAPGARPGTTGPLLCWGLRPVPVLPTCPHCLSSPKVTDCHLYERMPSSTVESVSREHITRGLNVTERARKTNVLRQSHTTERGLSVDPRQV